MTYEFFFCRKMAASPSIISTGADSGYPDSNWSGPPKMSSTSSESSVTSSSLKNGNNRDVVYEMFWEKEGRNSTVEKTVYVGNH